MFYCQLQFSLYAKKPYSDSGVKKIEMTMAGVNYIRKYQLNFS